MTRLTWVDKASSGTKKARTSSLRTQTVGLCNTVYGTAELELQMLPYIAGCWHGWGYKVRKAHRSVILFSQWKICSHTLPRHCICNVSPKIKETMRNYVSLSHPYLHCLYAASGSRQSKSNLEWVQIHALIHPETWTRWPSTIFPSQLHRHLKCTVFQAEQIIFPLNLLPSPTCLSRK